MTTRELSHYRRLRRDAVKLMRVLRAIGTAKAVDNLRAVQRNFVSIRRTAGLNRRQET